MAQLLNTLTQGGLLALQTRHMGAVPGGLLVEPGHLVLQGGAALGLGLALRAQGGGGALQRLDAGLGLGGVLRVLLHAAADLTALPGQGLAAQLDVRQLNLGAVRPLGVFQHRVLRLAQLGSGGVQLVLGGGNLPLGLCQLVRRGFQVGGQTVLLLIQPFQLVGPGQNARRAGYRAAGHGAAGVKHLAVQRDDAEAVAELSGHRHGLIHIPGDDHPPQQVGKDVGVLPVKGDDGIAHAHEAVLLFHALVPEVGGAHGVHGQEGGAACVPALEVADGVFAVLVPLHHQILHGAAQGDLNGHGILVGHMDQPRHRTPDAPQAVSLGLAHHQLDSLGIALVQLLHLGQHFDAGIEVVFVHLQAAVLLLGLVQLPLPGLEAHLVAADDVSGRVPVLGDLVQLLPGAVQRFSRLGRLVLLLLELLAQPFLPVVQLLGGGGQGGEQFLGLPGGGGLQPLPFLEALQLIVQGARRAQNLLGALGQRVDFFLTGGHVPLDLVQTAAALLDLGGDGPGPALLLLQLLTDALGVLAVVLDVVFQQGDAVFTGVHLLVHAGLLSPQLLRLDVLVPHLPRQLLAFGIQPLYLGLGLVPLTDGGVQVRAQLHAAGPDALQLLQPDGDLQALQLVPEDVILFCLFRL